MDRDFAQSGQVSELMACVVRRFPKDGLPSGQVQRLIDDPRLLEESLRGMVMGVSTSTEEKGILERLIVETGIKDVNSHITSKNFGITKEPDDRALVLAHPNKLASTKEVHAFMAKQGIQPEGPEYLARYARENPKAGLKFPIVALDPNKLWRGPSGDLRCVVLWSDDGVRNFNLRWLVNRWYDIFRFVGSRKQ